MVYAIKTERLSRDEFAFAVFLQGGVNKTQRSIVLDLDNYMAYVKDEVKYITLDKASDMFKDRFEGIAVFDLSADDVSINLAATVCAAENYLGVPRNLLHMSEGLKVKFDAADIRGSNAERQRAVFEKYKDKLDRRGLVHQVVKGDDYHLQLRDFAIAKGYLTFFTDETEEDIAFRKEALEWAERNIPVYGWTADEIGFVKSISEFGNYVIPMDWSCNHSFFGQSDYCSVKQKYSGREKVSSDKHYLCIAVSDGDNVQWLERNFMTDGHFGQRCRSNKGYKLNWTVAPSMGKLCPEVLQKIYSMANNDYFITGVSGIGYTNTMSYPYKYLSEYSALTEEAMKVSDLNYMCLLDNLALTSDEENVTKRLDEFAKYDRIGGGIWELDPDRYESGKGRVFWSSNGKPFVSVRLSMWHPSNDPDQTNDEWIKSYADKINSMPVCPDKIDGYTVLNVHPWTVNINQLNYFVSLLSENVEILFVKDFIEEIKKNVPHVNAVPEN